MESVPIWLFLVSVAATVIGPLAAVLITFELQRQDRNYQRRLGIFLMMMRSRRNWTNPDWVGSLNLVPVEFHKKPLVVEAFNKLLDRYTDPSWQGTREQQKRAIDNTEMSATELLQRMAKALKIDLHGLDLRSRAYAPTAWQTDEDANKYLRRSIIDLLNNKRSLNITLTEMDVENTAPSDES